MVIGLLILTSIPVVAGASLAISEQRNQINRKKDAKRMLKFHIDVSCTAILSRPPQIHNHRLILRDGKVWLGPVEVLNPYSQGYVAEAFYIEYPDPERVPIELGLVSQVQVEPVLLNWIYVDKDTKELRYGNKSVSIDHNVGPWDWTESEEGIIFDGVDAFYAVEAGLDKWQIYVDMDEDGLIDYVAQDRRKVSIQLVRTLIPGQETL